MNEIIPHDSAYPEQELSIENRLEIIEDGIRKNIFHG